MGNDVNLIELRLTDEGNGRTRFQLGHIAPADASRGRSSAPVPSVSAGTAA